MHVTESNKVEENYFWMTKTELLCLILETTGYATEPNLYGDPIFS